MSELLDDYRRNLDRLMTLYLPSPLPSAPSTDEAHSEALDENDFRDAQALFARDEQFIPAPLRRQ